MPKLLAGINNGETFSLCGSIVFLCWTHLSTVVVDGPLFLILSILPEDHPNTKSRGITCNMKYLIKVWCHHHGCLHHPHLQLLEGLLLSFCPLKWCLLLE